MDSELVMSLVVLIIAILVLRAVGAWMLRINEVIKYEIEILEELKKLNASGNKNQQQIE